VRVRRVLAYDESSPSGHGINDLDYLTAYLHGRRSLMAEGESLTRLCRTRNLPEFMNAVLPDIEFDDISGFQHALVCKLAAEPSGFLNALSGAGASLIQWMIVRFQVDNLKILLRAHLCGTPSEKVARYIVPLNGALPLDAGALAAAKTLEEFLSNVPRGFFRDCLEEAVEMYPDNLKPYFLEAALDNGYFQVLLQKFRNLHRFSHNDMEILAPLICQEVDILHLMHVIRGKFFYGLKPEALLPLHIPGTRISHRLFSEMLESYDVMQAMAILEGRVIDGLPLADDQSGDSDAETMCEHLAWTRYLRLANLAFRRSHIGFAAVAGYVGIRRIETANLITISEGIRKGLAPDKIRMRLIAPADREAAHV
jgi:vacuolar-type H+-ATPase subunit C/Vma6